MTLIKSLVEMKETSRKDVRCNLWRGKLINLTRTIHRYFMQDDFINTAE